jgi:hypothetical protein
LELLLKAFVEPEIVEQWMGTKVLKLKSKNRGSYQFETTDPQGNKYLFNGVIHEFNPNRKSQGHLKWRIRLFPSSLSS